MRFLKALKHAALGLMFGPKYWFDPETRARFEAPSQQPEAKESFQPRVWGLSPAPEDPQAEKDANNILTGLVVLAFVLSLVFTIVRIRSLR